MREAANASREDFADHLINVAPALPAVALALVAVFQHYTADFGLAYRAGAEAWANGHPQNLVTFTGTPFLALLMALVSRAAPEFVAARVFMAADLALWMVLLALAWPRLRHHVPQRLWWATLVATGLFAPAVSTIFWLQLNLVVFGLALAGFLLAGRNARWAGALIGLSLAIKPIAILLPLALLLRRRTRDVGAGAIVVAAALNAAGFAFLAWRAGDPHLLNPLDYMNGFLSKGRGAIAACIVENYSPVATLCRLGLQPSTLITVIVAGAVLVIAWLLLRHLPDTPQGRWELFAGACFLSILIGPIDWAHYGLLMGPMFVLLVYQFWRYGAPGPLWAGLAVSFVLVELVWDPLSSLAGASIPLEVFVYTAGQFSQYFLLLTWVRWRMLQASQRAPAGTHTASLVSGR